MALGSELEANTNYRVIISQHSEITIPPNGNSEVALAEDSFGNVGQIEISSEGQSTSLTSTDQVIEVTETREIAQREQSDEEKQEFK